MKMNLRCKCGFVETDEEPFIDTEVVCEDCGSHSAIRCPECDELYDQVYSGAYCLECGLVMDDYDDCPDHPDTNTGQWCFDPLNRGG